LLPGDGINPFLGLRTVAAARTCFLEKACAVPLARRALPYLPFRGRREPIPGGLDAASLPHTPLKERYRIPRLAPSDPRGCILQAPLPLVPENWKAGPGTDSKLHDIRQNYLPGQKK
jgi:hypothetical protein